MTASSKKISLNSLLPAMLGIGRTVMPGRAHVDQEHRDAHLLLDLGIGAGEQQAVVGGGVGVAVPDLLPVHDVAVAVAHGAGLERREVGAGFGLGEALAPDHVAGRHARAGAGPAARACRSA